MKVDNSAILASSPDVVEGESRDCVGGLLEIVALAAYAIYTSCTMFTCLTFELADVPVVGELIAAAYVPIAVTLLLAVIALRASGWGRLGLVGIAAFVAVFLLSGGMGGKWDLAFFFLLLLAIRGMDYRRFARVLMWELLAALVACLVCTKLLGFSEWWDFLDEGFVSGRGAYHPNLYSVMLFCAVLCIAFTIDRGRWLAPLLLVTAVCMLFSYFVQSSDTTLILFVVLLAALLIERMIPRVCLLFSRRRFFSLSLMVVICSIVLFVLVVVALYSPENEFVCQVDRLLHARIRLPNSLYREYGGYPILGRPLGAWTGSANDARLLGRPLMMLDSAYPSYALRAGLLAVACMLALFCRAGVGLGRRGPSFVLWVAIVAFAAYMVMEFTPAFLCLNCTLPFLAEGVRPKSELGDGGPEAGPTGEGPC